MIPSFEQILEQDYDKLRRNEFGTVVYEDRIENITDNIASRYKECVDDISTYDKFIAAQNPMLELLPPEPSYGDLQQYKYINNILIKELWQKWQPGERIYLAAGTGRGKNTFIKRELLRKCGSSKVVIFENRQSLMQQQIQDIVSEIDPDALKYQDIREESMFVFGPYKNFMLISYQTAALKCMLGNNDFYRFCSEARYLVFDEAHYIMDDASFNKGINFFVNTFLPQNNFRQAIKIYMSGSMEDFFFFEQEMNPKPQISNERKLTFDIIQEKNDIDNGKSSSKFKEFNWIIDYQNGISCKHILHLPTDYHYINPYKYIEMEEICKAIQESDSKEKWLVFVSSVSKGYELLDLLNQVEIDSVHFIDANNKTSSANITIYNQLINECKFDCRVLIATTVIYNGINVHDDAVKHIVVPSATVSVIKQLIGRKRMSDKEEVNVYFHGTGIEGLKKRFNNYLNDYINIWNLNRSLENHALVQLNGLGGNEISKYYYLYPIKDINGMSYLQPVLNNVAIKKLYYDLQFYLFAIVKSEDIEIENENVLSNMIQHGVSEITSGDSFVKLIMTELGIEDKYSCVTDLSKKYENQKRIKDSNSLLQYLTDMENIPIKSPDSDGSCDNFLKLKEKINEAYKSQNNGKNFDSHWKETNRFFALNKVNTWLKTMKFPFEIESSVENKIRTTIIRRCK